MLSAIFVSLAIFVSTLRLGRIASMHNLFSGSTSIHLPLLGLLMWCVVLNGEYLLSTIVLLVVCRILGFLLFAVRNNSSVAYLFNASLALAILPLFYPSAIALWVVMPIVLILSGATWREWVASLAGLVISFGGVSYIYWLCGYDLLYVGQTIAATLQDSSFPLTEFHTILPFRGVVMLISILLSLISPLWFDGLVPRTRSRLQILFILFLTLSAAFALPSSTLMSFTIISPLVALLLTFCMVQLRGGVISILYFILLLLTLLSMLIPLYLPLEQLIFLLQ